MVHANVTPAEVLSNILNDVSDEENGDFDDKCCYRLASNDEIDVTPSTAFNFDKAEDTNGADHNVANNDGSASISTGTAERRNLTGNRLVHDLESALDEQNYNPIGLSTAAKAFTRYLEKPTLPSNSGL